MAGAQRGRQRHHLALAWIFPVARVGSAEDRAQSYRRFLDAIAHVMDTQIIYFYRRREAEAVEGRRHRRLHARLVDLREDALGNYNQAQHEVHAALLGI